LDSIALDWRGQGLADRLAKDPMLGHVDRFEDYQLDVEAMFDIAQAQDMPKPWYLLAHSMGGGIALRTVMNGAPIDACAFSGPMWGIKMNPALRPAAWVISALASKLGLGSRFAPTTGRESYVATEPFETNALTRDADMHGFMQSQLIAYPRLQLGGPSLTWLFEALKETRALARHPSPNIPCITLMGSEETVVEAKSIPDRMNRWPGSALHVEPGGLHELLMEDAETRKPLVAKICQYFAENASAS
jgi:lysophospholipase